MTTIIQLLQKEITIKVKILDFNNNLFYIFYIIKTKNMKIVMMNMKMESIVNIIKIIK